MMSEEERELLRRMASVNSNGGTVHPILHEHPVSQRTTAFLHLAMTGAVVHIGADGERTALTREEMMSLFARFHELCERASLHHTYAQGDLVMIDNWAVAHRARDGSFDPSHGLRVVHRTTVKSNHLLLPPAAWLLPPEFPQVGNGGNGSSPFPATLGREPVWVEGYVGFRWRPCSPVDFLGTRPREYVLMQVPQRQ
jgi:taurine dioxygenase